MNTDFIINHLGEDRDHYLNAVIPPVFQTSNFDLKDVPTMRKAFENEQNVHLYTRGNNPTVEILRKKIAALEKADDCLVFASGVAAISAAVMNTVSSGDHVICVQSPYSWTTYLLSKYLSKFNISVSYVDGSSIQNIEAAIQPNTKLLFLESPNTLLFELQDIRACTTLAKKHQIRTIIDNSYCSPIFQNPIEMGVDIVVHSASKYLNGHSDLLAGVVCASQEIINSIFQNEFMTLGGIISPHDASLMLRGLRTLPLRIQRSHDSAMKVVNWLAEHPKVRKVYYPFHPSHPQYELAQQQMKGCGGLFSVDFECDDLDKMEHFIHQIQNFTIAVSWGGFESLMIPTCGFYNIPNRPNPSLPISFVRFYIGLEEPEFLIEDLEKALDVI